jgi:hypothetical protein
MCFGDPQVAPKAVEVRGLAGRVAGLGSVGM